MPPRKKMTKATKEGLAPAVFSDKAPAPKPAGYVFGRPTSYDPSYCQLAIDLGREGKSRTYIAGTIGVARQTLDNWASANPDFFNALEVAKALEQIWWEDAGQEGMKTQGFGQSIWSRNMAARFREDWTDRHEVTGANGGPVKFQDISGVSEEELRHLAAAGVGRVGSEGVSQT